MLLADAPTKLVLPFANSGGKNAIPVPSQIGVTPGAASFTDGFPPLTMTALAAGGVPPSGHDMNGILYALSAVIQWLNSGAAFPFDATYGGNVGGYPKGARVLRADGLGFWTNTVDNNTNNPDTAPLSTSGWIPANAGTLTASVYASAQQTIVSGGAKILWNTVEYDAFGLWVAGSKRFSALVAGRYRFSGATYLPAVAGNDLAADIYVNGSLAKRCCQFPQVSDVDITLPFNAILNLNAGDYVEAFLNASLVNVLAGAGAGSSQAYVYGQFEYLGK